MAACLAGDGSIKYNKLKKVPENGEFIKLKQKRFFNSS